MNKGNFDFGYFSFGYRNPGHWDVSDDKRRIFAIRGDEEHGFIIRDERKNEHGDWAEDKHHLATRLSDFKFPTLAAAVACITALLMAEPVETTV